MLQQKDYSQNIRQSEEIVSQAEAAPAHLETSAKRRILLTGAAGGIGSAFFQHAASRYTFRLADRLSIHFENDEQKEHEAMQLEIANLDACQQACQGMDTVVHLAADPNPDADFMTSLLSNNILGTYNILRAAKDQGCRRVVLASSLQVVLGYARDVQTHHGSPLRPMNMYGVSKCFVENVASYFSYAEHLSCIAVRIGAYDNQSDPANWMRKSPHLLDRTAYISPRDLNQLLTRCIDIASVLFAIVDGISNNRFKRADPTPTHDLLGYQPEDDGFEIFP